MLQEKAFILKCGDVAHRVDVKHEADVQANEATFKPQLVARLKFIISRQKLLQVLLWQHLTDIFNGLYVSSLARIYKRVKDNIPLQSEQYRLSTLII